jgi:transcriptional regulator with XRE-family HTH domain
MVTRNTVETLAFLEQLAGGPLTFGRLLRAIREGDATSQVDFARRLGVSKQNLSDLEHDRRGVSVERAASWATTLGYHPEQFVQLALQAQVRAAGLPYAVRVTRLRDAA